MWCAISNVVSLSLSLSLMKSFLTEKGSQDQQNLVTLISNYDTKDVHWHTVNAKLASMILKKDSVSPPC